jgi:hypothetical protein
MFLWKYRKSFYRLSDILKNYPSIGLFLIAIGFLSSVQIFDLNFIKPSFVVKIEELFEMNGALTVLFASLSAVHTARIDKLSRTLESNEWKHMPLFIAGSLSFFVIIGVASYFILSAHTIKHEHESRKYVKQIIPLILTSWDAEAFIENVPSVLSVNSHDEIRGYFSARSQHFGHLKQYRFSGSQFGGSRNLHVNLGVKNKTILLERVVIFEHDLFAVFENVRATIHVETVMLEGAGWKITSMKIEPIK